MKWTKLGKEMVMPLDDDILSDWLENPKAFGAYEGNTLITSGVVNKLNCGIKD